MAGFEGLSGAHRRAALRRGLRVDHLGDERLVLDPASGVVHTLRGAAVKALDAILSRRPAADDEVVAALVASGIVEVRGVSRREALLLAGSASALIASVALPSALAAASTASFTPSGDGSVIEYTLASPVGARLYRLVNASESTSDTLYRLTTAGSTTIEVLLVAGGGPGGEPGSTSTTDEFFGGGGGGGEVVFLALGSVSGGTQLDFTVGGTSTEDMTIGRSSSIVIGSDSVTAKGGGRGAARILASAAAAESGGSGGGASPLNTTAGSSSSGAVVGVWSNRTAYLSSGGGADGSHRAGGGGGGANSTGAASASTAGGAGGSGVDLATVTGWDLTVSSGDSPTASGVPNRLGSGGGGAGFDTRGSSDQSGGSSRGGFYIDGVGAVSGQPGPLGSGAGGGGGIRAFTGSVYLAADPGGGGSGVVWVRTS